MSNMYTILDLIAELVFVAERDTLRILFANATACQLVGYSQEQMLHLKFTDLYPDLADLEPADLASQSTPFTSNLMCADGSEFPTRIRLAPQLVQATPCIVCVADLATDLHTVARSLQEQRMIYRALIMGIFDLFFRIRRDGTYIDFKIPNGLGLYQPAEAGEIIGRTVAKVVPPHVTAVVMPVIERVIATGQPETVEYHIEESNGLHYYEAHFAASLPDEIIAVVRDITDHKRTEAVLRQQRDLSVALSSSISLEQALTRVLDAMIDVAQMDGGGVYLIDPETGALHLKHQRGLTDAFIEQVSFFPPEAPQTRIIKQGDTIFSDYRELPVPPGDPGLREGLRAFAMIPIRDQHEVIGCINLASRRLHVHDINSATRDVLKTMAFHSGSAIMRLRIEDRLRRERAIAETLREVGMVLTSTLDLDEVLKRLLDQAKRVVPYDAANVMLIEEDTARIVVHAGYGGMGVSPNAIAGTTFRLKDAVYLANMIQTGKPFVCPDVAKDPNWIFKPSSMWTRSWLGAPILVRDTTVGFFSLDSHVPDFYGQRHIELIEPFVKQAAIAFENASLFAEIQSLERIKSEMIRIASHDLRSPLMRIQETITAFKRNGRQNLTEQQAKYCDLIGDAAQDMERIISNILSLERIEAQHQATKTIIWCDLIQQSITIVQADLTARQHCLTVSCEKNLPNTRGDPDRLQQALVNLLGNAIKFTPPGGAITVRAYRKHYGIDETVAVEVEDDGIGIPYEQQAGLFRPFYRAHQSEVEHVTGTGLGLSIVKKVVEYHQGNVYVNSIPGEGSLFGFWVPI